MEASPQVIVSMTPLFTVIMPSYLGDYPGAASNREAKLLRAVESVIDQSHQEWELVVVADGCERTDEILAEHIGDRRVRLLNAERSELWCPGPRNVGLHHAKGRWIAYCDIDDYLGSEHLSGIAGQIEDGMDWAYFDALFYDKRLNAFLPKPVQINKCAGHGTANIVHRRIEGLYWPSQRRNRDNTLDYGTQDCVFVDVLKKLPGRKINAGEYHVCHLPPKVVGAYDV